MAEDAELVLRGASGDECAFAELVRRYQEPVKRLIHYQVGAAEVEDLLQETLVQAWRDLSRLRRPDLFRAWLLQVARNRCRDFRKRAARRERVTADEELEAHANRAGRILLREREAVVEVEEALEEIGTADGDLVRDFYLGGWTISEIADRDRLPEGTVKRRLFRARHHLRELLDVEQRERKDEMKAHRKGSKSQPFPAKRPQIDIKPSRAKPFAVDCRELKWWFGIPEVGARTLWTIYDPPDWKLANATDMRSVRRARVHDLEGVEIEVDEWTREEGWEPVKWTMYGRLSEMEVQWLATARMVDGERRLSTFLDEEFMADWGGPEPRRLEDKGRFVEVEDGVYEQRKVEPGGIGAGMFTISVGDRRFTCLRVLDVPERVDEGGTLVEAYLEKNGRTVLFRRYNGRKWKLGGERRPWDEAFPEHRRLVIEGVTYVHWYDCLTGLACGL